MLKDDSLAIKLREYQELIKIRIPINKRLAEIKEELKRLEKEDNQNV